MAIYRVHVNVPSSNG